MTPLLAQLEIRPNAGANFSYFNEDIEENDFSGRVGYNLGVDLLIGDRFYLAPGVHFFVTNNRVDVLEVGNVVEAEVEFQVKGFRIPVVAGAKLIQSDAFTLRLYGGGALSTLIDREDDLANLQDLVLENNVWNVTAGLGFDFGQLVTVDLKHDWGVSDLFAIDGVKSRQNVIYLTAGIRL